MMKKFPTCCVLILVVVVGEDPSRSRSSQYRTSPAGPAPPKFVEGNAVLPRPIAPVETPKTTAPLAPIRALVYATPSYTKFGSVIACSLSSPNAFGAEGTGVPVALISMNELPPLPRTYPGAVAVTLNCVLPPAQMVPGVALAGTVMVGGTFTLTVTEPEAETQFAGAAEVTVKL